jgi:plasmid maintenance system killer protein
MLHRPCSSSAARPEIGSKRFVANDVQHSIRINAQWRLCFIWTDNGPCDVEIVDYH